LTALPPTGSNPPLGVDFTGVEVGPYEILSPIGEGGMGDVYLARHRTLGKQAAIKVLRRDLCHDDDQLTRFANEARAASAIDHPGIVNVIDFGRLPPLGLPYLVMEFIDGETVAERLRRRGRLPAAEAIAIARQTASALQAAHERGIIHRDLKPENLMLAKDPAVPGGERVKVLDFGIAKLTRDLGAGLPTTATGTTSGTPKYMSPEQCRGLPNGTDHRADIYALGVILYQLLSGRLPFESAGAGDLMIMQITMAPEPLRTHVPETPLALERVVLRALEKDREQRYPSMQAFDEALASVEQGRDTARVRAVNRQRRRALIAVTATVLVLGAAAATFAWRPLQERTKPVVQPEVQPSAPPATPTPVRPPAPATPAPKAAATATVSPPKPQAKAKRKPTRPAKTTRQATKPVPKW
jgi:serine/threonine protein kinase